MTARSDSTIEHNSTIFVYDNHILSMVENRQSTDYSFATDNTVKIDYRLSLSSSSQFIHII